MKLPFEDGSDDWIEVKSRLNYGESLELSVAAARDDNESASAWITRYFPVRAALWLTDWSFVDKDGEPVELAVDGDLRGREAQIKALEPEAGREIARLLEAHEERVAAGLGKGELSAETTATTDPPLPASLRSSTAA